jgi:hypothetical protein
MTGIKLNRSIAAALVSALLFGVSTPLAKALVVEVPPLALAGLLYLGSGVGLLTWRWLRQRKRAASDPGEAPLARTDWGWMAGAVLAGGIIAPVLLMLGLAGTTGSAAALLLNFEGVFTALIAWFIFHENVDRRVASGFFLIVVAGVRFPGLWAEPEPFCPGAASFRNGPHRSLFLRRPVFRRGHCADHPLRASGQPVLDRCAHDGDRSVAAHHRAT